MVAVVLHVPHSATLIPEDVLAQFVVPNEVLKSELVRMTDHLTLELFNGAGHTGPVVAAEVSRLVVDVERFADDADEPMVAKGMGVIYTRLADGGVLRGTVSTGDRQRLLAHFYKPHHTKFCSAVQGVLGSYGCCLIVDAHSFPSRPLPYEFDQSLSRPDICIGTDPFHTASNVRRTFVQCFEKQGFVVKVDRPFSGAIVPTAFYLKDRRVMSVMVEVNRALYLDEITGTASADFDGVARRVQAAVREASGVVLGEIAN
jgi:N-formylglutamate amidohydrolase